LERLKILFEFLVSLVKDWFNRHAMIAENLALRSQLALFTNDVQAGKRTKPQATKKFRIL